jgi:DNA-binding IclR family transcriptional regulator
MRVSAPFQEEVLKILLRYGRPMSLRQITQSCSLGYHQVASCLIALKAKGYVRNIKFGVYEVTEDAKLEELSPETQIKILKQKISELENIINKLLIRK